MCLLVTFPTDLLKVKGTREEHIHFEETSKILSGQVDFRINILSVRLLTFLNDLFDRMFISPT